MWQELNLNELDYLAVGEAVMPLPCRRWSDSNPLRDLDSINRLILVGEGHVASGDRFDGSESKTLAAAMIEDLGKPKQSTAIPWQVESAVSPSVYAYTRENTRRSPGFVFGQSESGSRTLADSSGVIGFAERMVTARLEKESADIYPALGTVPSAQKHPKTPFSTFSAPSERQECRGQKVSFGNLSQLFSANHIQDSMRSLKCGPGP
jgi:hypothetical protein